MKRIPEWTIFNSLIYLWLLCCSSCNSREFAKIDGASQKIDSLIEIQHVNEQCIIITFGAESITAISTKKGIVVIDAGISSGLTARYRKIIENEFQSNDFTYVIHSHGHPDHTGGNSIFSGSGIIGHVNCIQEITGPGNNPEKKIMGLGKIVEEYESRLQEYEAGTKEWEEIFTQKTRYGNAYLDAKNIVPVKLPDITFSDSMNMDMGDVTFEMYYFGKCHSNSDIFIYVPGMKILFIGDLFSKFGRPSIHDTLMADKDRWQQAIHWIEKRMGNMEKIMGGHGQMLSIDDLTSFNSNISRECSKE
jgi:glyoxylase-like metal-dependent hydrolase (beta-lactamase superfamily II)